MSRFLAGMRAVIVGLSSIAIVCAAYLLPAISWFYFLWRAAATDHFIWFMVGLIIPPIGVVGGVLACLGLVWAPNPVVSSDSARSEAAKNYSVIMMVDVVLGRCEIPEINAAARARVSAALSAARQAILDLPDVTEADLPVLEGAAVGAGKAVNCSDPTLRSNLIRNVPLIPSP